MRQPRQASAHRLLISGGTVVSESGSGQADVLVEGERVVRVGPDLLGAVDVNESFDAGGALVMPGAIDLHVHFEEPGITEREGYWSGTRAAAAGGITLVVEHPLSDPPTTTADRYNAKRAAVEPSAWVDFGLWGGAAPGNLPEFEGMAAAGAPGFKAFMVGSEPELPRLEDEGLSAAMREAARLGSIMVVHAEDEVITASLAQRLREQGRHDPLAWAESRPPSSEARAVERALALAELVDCRLQVAHLSTAGSVAVAAAARAAGARVAVETCPHFLLLNETDLERLGPWAKTAPPLRSRREQAALWDQVAAGAVDFVASDHAPWAPREKEPGLISIWEAPNGLQSLQLMTVLTLEAWTARGLPLERWVSMASAAPARWLGIHPRKGAIVPGADADIAIYAQGPRRAVRAGELYDRHRWTPFAGMETSFTVRATLVRGRWVYREGAFAPAPFGKFVPMSPADRREGKSLEVSDAGR